MGRKEIWFFATSRSGLGHLRRVSTIARAVSRQAPDHVLRLVTNAPPEGLEPADTEVFAETLTADRDKMSALLDAGTPSVAVLDTLALPGVEATPARLALVLREVPEDRLARFRLDGGRPWDRIIVANPEPHWMPSLPPGMARAVTATGWIYRPTGPRPARRPQLAEILVATGGGGTTETAALLYPAIDRLLASVRDSCARPFRVVQALGPRARAFGRLARADAVIDPGGRLNEMFRDADIVLSTAGYNSVLELATTDTPALLMPIPRSIDDQTARAQSWGPRLGAFYDDREPWAAADWLAARIDRPRRRQPVEIGPSGENAAAAMILELT